jgi:putative hydrolase of the HAD superfamily
VAKPRYDTVFLDVDGTLLWVDLDVEGYVRDLAPYSSNGGLTVEKATGPLRESVRRHIKENIKHRTEESLAGFKRRNAEVTAGDLGIAAPAEVLTEVAERRISFNPYPEAEGLLAELKNLGLGLYVVSNWDVLLESVLSDLGWTGYFDGIVVSAVVGSEKPDGGIFDEALRVSGNLGRRDRVVHVGNDPVADVEGAAACGIDTVFVDRGGGGRAPKATYALPDLRGLRELLGS